MPRGYLEGGSVPVRRRDMDWGQSEFVLEEHGTPALDEIPNVPEVSRTGRRRKKCEPGYPAGA